MRRMSRRAVLHRETLMRLAGDQPWHNQEEMTDTCNISGCPGTPTCETCRGPNCQG
jgi:hypothetical protein